MCITIGTPAPLIVYGHTTVAYDDKIILMGGYETKDCRLDGSGYSKAIYE